MFNDQNFLEKLKNLENIAIAGYFDENIENKRKDKIEMVGPTGTAPKKRINLNWFYYFNHLNFLGQKRGIFNAKSTNH